MALPKPDPDQVAAALALLESFAGDRGLLADIDLETRQRLLIAAGRIALPDAREEKKLARAFRKQRAAEKRAADEAALATTGIRAARKESVFLTPPATPTAITAGGETQRPLPAVPELRTPRSCYICKQAFTKLHHFYDSMCTACGDFNFERRNQTADLRGRIALVTGGRVKIGYHAVIKLLRAGAKVIVTTRFARDAAARFAKESDFEEWGDRLEVYGLDLRHTPSVERLAAHLLETLPRLDFIIHNACQTVRRPPGFYAHMMERETAPLQSLPAAEQPLVSSYEALRESEASAWRSATSEASDVPRGAAESLRLGAGLFEAARLSQKALTPEDRALPTGTGSTQMFPEGRLDQDLQQVDLREMNSWRLRMHEVATIELLEVQLVNAVAPFVLSARLKPLLVKERTFDKHVVNVSAMEGQFNRGLKTENHPHTNMAKAALNMLTRTSAQDYARDGVYMNSVDTGWVTDEDPAVFAERKAVARGGEVFQPPLDIVDGAARIVDPIFNGLITGEHVWGKFLKDYRPTEW